MIAAFRLTEYLGIPGACILLAMGFIISIILISNKSLESSVGWAYKKIKKMFIPKSLINDNTQNIIDRDFDAETYETERSVIAEEERLIR